MYDLAPENAPWFEHLTDGVRALGHAALDWRHAAQAAAVDHARADHPGLTHHEGRVTALPVADGSGWRDRPRDQRPHSVAQRRLGKHYRDAMYATRQGYEDAARLYASGAAWAVRQVQDGAQPALIEFASRVGDQTLLELVPGDERVGADALAEACYSEAAMVTDAYENLDRRLCAAQLAEDIGSQDYVADHEASEMHRAWTSAEGIADAAYAYGLVLERALQFVLLGPKQARREQLAAARDVQDGVAQ
jgi:hypothetical protein